MKTPHYSIKAGEFKAKCLQLMDDVNEKHITIIITKHGKPIARLTPIEEAPVEYFGCLADTVTINEDIVAPIDVHWEANE